MRRWKTLQSISEANSSKLAVLEAVPYFGRGQTPTTHNEEQRRTKLVVGPRERITMLHSCMILGVRVTQQKTSFLRELRETRTAVANWRQSSCRVAVRSLSVLEKVRWIKLPGKELVPEQDIQLQEIVKRPLRLGPEPNSPVSHNRMQ